MSSLILAKIHFMLHYVPMSISEVLNKRLEAIKEARTDTEVFKHIHGYIKYVLNTPELKAVLDAEEADFYHKVKFTDDNIKLEKSNFYQSYFINSFLRIYSPIETYQESNQPDEKQDPVALLLIWGFNHPRTKRWVNGHPVFNKKERLSELKSYWAWFDGQTQDYVNEIGNLHIELITALSKKRAVKMPEVKEIPLVLNLQTGDFNLGSISGALNTATQEFRVLAKLYTADNHKANYLELIKCLRSNADMVTKPDKADLAIVIRNIKKQLGILPHTHRVNDDIFKNDTKHGYRLVFPD